MQITTPMTEKQHKNTVAEMRKEKRMRMNRQLQKLQMPSVLLLKAYTNT